ncbi:MAG: hypothetical protein JNK63_08190 [Chthonomonas sp.]|nr:hypothetical protein [Chthonomonas sp.]
MKDYLFRGMIGGLVGGLLGFGYHTYVVNSATVCYSCDKSSTPIIVGTLIGMAIACFGRK